MVKGKKTHSASPKYYKKKKLTNEEAKSAPKDDTEHSTKAAPETTTAPARPLIDEDGYGMFYQDTPQFLQRIPAYSSVNITDAINDPEIIAYP